MTQFEDSTGLFYTADSQAAVDALEDVQNAYLGSRRDVTDRMKADGYQADMPMTRVVSGFLGLMFSTPQTSAAARSERARLSAESDPNGLNDRELRFVAALEAWCDGALDTAAQHLENVLGAYPKDAFALKIAQYLHLYGGTPQAMVESVARVYPAWSEHDPSFGYVQGMYAFALEEAGDYRAAEAMGKAAVDAHADDAWAAHAVAHVFEMEHRPADGVAWLAALSDRWAETNNFRYHLDWHEALFHLELGQMDEALAVYDQRVREDLGADFYLDQCNATALLQRLVLHGVDVGDRWQELAEVASRHLTDQELVFANVHHLIALLAVHDADGAKAVIDGLDRWAAGQQGEVAGQAGAPLARALAAYADGDFQGAASAFEGLGEAVERIGGSHAQRDLFHMIHVEALIQAAHYGPAESMLVARSRGAPPTSWNVSRLESCRQLAASRPGAG